MNKPETTNTAPDNDDITLELSAEEAAQLAAWKAEESGGNAADADEDADDNASDDEDEDDNDGTGSGEDAGEEQETESEEEEETEEEKEEEEETEGEEKPDKTKVQKRFDALTAQKKTLETQLAQAQQEITTLKSGARPGEPLPLVPLAEDPLAHLTSPEAVESAIEKAQGFIKWAKANKNGATVEGTEMSAEDIEAFRDEQEAILAAAPKRLKWLADYQQGTAAARASYPELFQQGTDANAFVSQVIKLVPGLARHPLHEQLIGDMFAGAQLRLGNIKAVKASPVKAAAPAKTAAAVKTAKPSLSSSASSPSSAPRGSKPDTSAILDKAYNGQMDSDDAVAALLESRFG
jgi:hypothetical protein